MPNCDAIAQCFSVFKAYMRRPKLHQVIARRPRPVEAKVSQNGVKIRFARPTNSVRARRAAGSVRKHNASMLCILQQYVYNRRWRNNLLSPQDRYSTSTRSLGQTIAKQFRFTSQSPNSNVGTDHMPSWSSFRVQYQ